MTPQPTAQNRALAEMKAWNKRGVATRHLQALKRRENKNKAHCGSGLAAGFCSCF
jgi:hypothetical protein